MTENNEKDSQGNDASESEAYKVFLDHRQTLIESRFQISIGLDKAILTLSAGALAISMTFITDIIKTPTSIWQLITAWFLFGVAIASDLLSIYFCQMAYGKGIKNLDANYSEQTSTHNKNNWSIVTRVGAVVSIFTFILGLLFLGLFIRINLNNCLGDKNESTKTTTTQTAAQTAIKAETMQRKTDSQSSTTSVSTTNTKKTK
ncbi:MAG: hypothetical protein KAJ07_03695 [Planctomycetes bacterium]|nr:hypothetical protein [Planctomycetota bacterium]